MPLPAKDEKKLYTSAGDFSLNQYCLRDAGREWKILHVDSVLSQKQENDFLRDKREKIPYGITLWTAAIALAHDIVARAPDFRGTRVLELGAGTGLPGIVAASFGAQVLQTDRNELAISVARRNLQLNDAARVEQRLVDWADWTETTRFDWIIGSDILYAEDMHARLRRIFEQNLAPHGKLLISDPFRAVSFKFLEPLEAAGWSVSLNKWTIGEESAPRAVGVFELAPPKS